MARTPVRKARKNNLSISVIVGTLLVPLSAVAAMSLTRPEPAVAAHPQRGVAEAADLGQLTQVLYVDQPATADDLEKACGKAGKRLVSAEEEGTITDVQQAALDALRQICEDQGMPLPGKPAPDPIIQTIIVSATPNTSAAVDDTQADDESSDQYAEDDSSQDDEYTGDSEYEDDQYEDHSGEDEPGDEEPDGAATNGAPEAQG